MACEKCSANEDNVKHKQRESAEKKALLTRLSRIEGQDRCGECVPWWRMTDIV